MRPTRSAASAAGPSEKTTSGASNETQPGKNGSSHSGNASVASRRSSSASLEKYELQPSKLETAKELNGHHDSSSTTNVQPEKSVHNTRLRNGIQKLKVPVSLLRFTCCWPLGALVGPVRVHFFQPLSAKMTPSSSLYLTVVRLSH